MQNFELYNPVKVIFGKGESDNIGKTVCGLGKTAMLVSYEEHSFLTGLLEKIKAQLTQHGIKPVEFYKIKANPHLSDVLEAVEICKKENVDFCIGIGGGSVMDSTKVIAAGVKYSGKIWDMFVSRHDREIGVPPTDTLPTVMVPTLPATSSETNCIAVVTNDETHEKAYVSTPVIYPTISVADPLLTCTLPLKQTAIGAVDAMSHVLEAYLNGDQNSPLQDRLNEALLVTIMSELRKIMKNPSDSDSRANLQWAISLSWNGYLHSGLNATTPMHQMGHVLSARYNTPHGITLAIFIDSYFRYTSVLNEERENRFAVLGKNVFGVSCDDKRKAAEKTVQCFIDFMDEAGVIHTLKDAGIPSEDIEKIADEIVKLGCDKNGNLPSIPPIGRSGIVEVLKMSVGN